MERRSSPRSSRSSSQDSIIRKSKRDYLLPFANTPEKPVYRIGSMVRHFLYRRVLIWTLISLLLASFVLFKHRDGVYNVAHFGSSHSNQGSNEPLGGEPGENEGSSLVVTDGADGEQVHDDNLNQNEIGADGIIDVNDKENEEQKKKEDDQLSKMIWLKFPHLDGYFHGLKTLVSKQEHYPEYPNLTHVAPLPTPPIKQELPTPKPFSPYHDEEGVKTCFLDKEGQVPAPDIYAYDGLPQHFPDPAIGSYGLVGIRDDVCFDRFGRYGPYGFGYRKLHGGSEVGIDTEKANSEEVWKKSGQINYTKVDWGEAQERCVETNSHRFKQVDPATEELEESKTKKSRTAVVIRLYTDFQWTELSIINFRAMINELSLRSGGEYTVHFLMHVRDWDIPIWSDDLTVQRVLRDNVPPEFHNIVTLWSEPQMKLYYPGKFSDAIDNPSGAPIHGVYRSAHYPLQMFALQHPEYEHFWNWEMDMRYTGSFYELFDRLGKFGEQQPRAMLWERNERYYIPSYHGDWQNFSQTVQQDTLNSGRKTVFGPVQFPGNKPLRHEQKGQKVMPEDCYGDGDHANCGVGEPADIITLNPLFDADESGWVFGLDVTGYGANENPPRRCAIITASRLSRRLLKAMHEEVWRHHHTMFSEMFPASVALHHGYKGVYAPHPVFIDRAWTPPQSIDAAFNGGRDHSTSGPGSPFDVDNEHNHKGTSWYYNSEFAGLLWRRWLGFSQIDGRGDGGGVAGFGNRRGGVQEESSEESSGRLCLRSMLVHPIKREDAG